MKLNERLYHNRYSSMHDPSIFVSSTRSSLESLNILSPKVVE